MNLFHMGFPLDLYPRSYLPDHVMCSIFWVRVLRATEGEEEYIALIKSHRVTWVCQLSNFKLSF